MIRFLSMTPGRAAIAGLILALVAGTGCSDSTGPKTPAHVGVWDLLLVNNDALPGTVFQNSSGRIIIESGTLTLRDDLSYHETRNYRSVLTTGETSPFTANEDGIYSVVGSQITFTIPPNGSLAAVSFSGAVSGSNLSYIFERVAFQYQK
jgi:hypothetical protein